MQQSDNLEQRVEALENRNRMLAALLLVTIAMAGLTAASNNSVVRGSAFELVDGKGVVRADLAMRDGAPGLHIRDTQGNDRLVASHGDAGTTLYLYDDTGTTRIGIAQFAHGGGGVALHGPHSKGAAVLYFKDSGSLRFYDEDGKVVTEMNGGAAK